MRYLRNVVTLQLDPARCNGCGMCTRVCPHGVFRIEDRRAVIAERDACMECGACAGNCEQEAIRVKSGVGCAAGVLAGFISGTEPTCGCAEEGSSGGGCCC